MKNNFKINLPIALLITLITVFYQRSTGPTYPKKFKFDYQQQSYKIKLLRSHGGKTDAPLELPLITPDAKAEVSYKRFPTNDEWTTVAFVKQNNRLLAQLPHQPPAGKHLYYIKYSFGNKVEMLGTALKPIVIRFKGAVPTAILAPHIFFMFLSMLLAVLAALEALNKTSSFYPLTIMTFSSLIVGGMILGPFVQKFAFGVYWAGFPYDWDLTDNKLLIAVLAWSLAFFLNLKKRRPLAPIMAALVLFVVYSIPHSMMGSQYDYKKGKVVTDKK